MLTHILHNSVELCTFVDRLGVQLCHPQRRHLMNVAEALGVCETQRPVDPFLDFF